MKPFQSIYYICHNPAKVITIFIMIALTGLLYLGGIYLFNIEVEYLKTLESERDVAYVNLNGMTKEQGKEAFLEEIKNDETLHLYPVGANDFSFPTVLTFTNGNFAFSYSVEDFLWRNERTGWVEDISLVQNNTLFLTKRYAEYLGLKDGDILDKGKEELTLYYGELPYSVHIMEGDGFGVLLIADESVQNEYYHLTWNEKDNEEGFPARLKELKEKYTGITISAYEERVEETKEEFTINNVIFFSILMVVICVFFITINAVLVGIYDTRNGEFHIYESIGIPKAKIRRKVVGELLIMSGVGMIIGMILSFAAITLLNVFVFAKDSLQLYYYHPRALWAWLVCNIMILIPSIVLRLRALEKGGF